MQAKQKHIERRQPCKATLMTLKAKAHGTQRHIQKHIQHLRWTDDVSVAETDPFTGEGGGESGFHTGASGSSSPSSSHEQRGGSETMGSYFSHAVIKHSF